MSEYSYCSHSAPSLTSPFMSVIVFVRSGGTAAWPEHEFLSGVLPLYLDWAEGFWACSGAGLGAFSGRDGLPDSEAEVEVRCSGGFPSSCLLPQPKNNKRLREQRIIRSIVFLLPGVTRLRIVME